MYFNGFDFDIKKSCQRWVNLIKLSLMTIAYSYIHIHTFMHAYIYISTHIHIYTYIHTYTFCHCEMVIMSANN